MHVSDEQRRPVGCIGGQGGNSILVRGLRVTGTTRINHEGHDGHEEDFAANNANVTTEAQVLGSGHFVVFVTFVIFVVEFPSA